MDWDLDNILSEDDINFEFSLLKDPHMSIWLKYYRSVPESNIRLRVLILRRATQTFPRSYKLWDLYLNLRISILKKSISSYHSINKNFERALVWLNKFPYVWLKYLNFLVESLPFLYSNSITFVRQTFNRALVQLPTTQHHIIWEPYLRFADEIGGATGVQVYKNYLKFAAPVDLQTSENGITISEVISKLVDFGGIELSSEVFHEVFQKYESDYYQMEISQLQFLTDYMEDLISKGEGSENVDIIRDTDIDLLVQMGLRKFPDQISKLYLLQTKYYSTTNNFPKAKYLYDKGLKECFTVRDFVTIFESFVEFEESVIEEMAGSEEEVEESMESNLGLNIEISFLENLLESRPILLSDLLINQDPNNLDEWFKRISIYETRNDINSVLTTYAKALTTINPFKAHSLSKNQLYTLPQLWIKYANVYASNEDYNTASIVLSKSIQSQFQFPDDLVTLYIEWSGLELKAGNDSKAVEIIEQGCNFVPDGESEGDIAYEDTSLSVHMRLHKSTKLWAYYIDLLESFVDSGEPEEISKVCDAYDKLILLKIVTPLNIINYANFLEEWNLIEKSFTVYELGLKIFKYPVSFEIWNIYLVKVIANGVEIERIRDLFEQCLAGCPSNLSKPIILLYSNFEEKNGLLLKSVKILKAGIEKLKREEESQTKGHQMILSELYQALIVKQVQLNDVESVRNTFEDIFSSLVHLLSTNQLIDFGLKFIDFEALHQQYSRSKLLFKFICELKPPQDLQVVWDAWENFELSHGDENTYKEMLRYKRGLYSKYEQEIQSKSTPVGFVKAKAPIVIKEPTKVEAKPENPDEIDLEMD